MLHPTSSVLDRDIRDLGQQARIYEGPRRARVTLVGALITESNTPAPPPRTTESTHALPASASLDTEHPDGFEIGAERCLHEAILASGHRWPLSECGRDQGKHMAFASVDIEGTFDACVRYEGIWELGAPSCFNE